MGDRSELLRRARSGDDGAIGALLAGHAAALRALISRELPSRHRSVLGEDDVLQQTWVDAFHGFESFAAGEPRESGAGEVDAALGRWLATLARRNVIDAVRMLDAAKRGGRDRRAAPAELLDELTDGRVSRSPSRAAATREAMEALRPALAALPERYRTVISLYDLDGRGIEEVSAAVGRSAGAVYMLRARALRLLREKMGSTGRYMS